MSFEAFRLAGLREEYRVVSSSRTRPARHIARKISSLPRRTHRLIVDYDLGHNRVHYRRNRDFADSATDLFRDFAPFCGYLMHVFSA